MLVTGLNAHNIFLHLEICTLFLSTTTMDTIIYDSVIPSSGILVDYYTYSIQYRHLRVPTYSPHNQHDG
jgi:hypothetical protein